MPNIPVRQRTDAQVAGVCAALGRAWSVDPLLLRVAFVVLGVLTNGFVVAAYLALWALLPEPGQPSLVRQWFPVTRKWPWPWMVAAVVAVTSTLGALVSGSGPGAFLILALAWVILRSGFAGRRAQTEPTPPSPLPTHTTPFERASHAWQLRLHNLETGRPADWVPELEHARTAATTAEAHLPPARTRARRRRSQRTWLGLLVGLGLAWAGLGVAYALEVVVTPLAWVSSSLLVLGMALVWSARPARAAWGRAPLLLPLTIVVSLATLPLLFPAPAPASRLTSPLPPQPVPGTILSLPLGENRLDLSALPAADETLRYRLDLGDVTLVVPREGNVVVDVRVELGEVALPDGSADGVDVRRSWSRIDDPDAPTRTIQVEVGLGEVRVEP